MVQVLVRNSKIHIYPPFAVGFDRKYSVFDIICCCIYIKGFNKLDEGQLHARGLSSNFVLNTESN